MTSTTMTSTTMTSTTIPGTNPTGHADADHAAGVHDVRADVRAEFRALLSGCGLYDMSGRSKITLTGTDRVRWLNGMLTNNIRDLVPGHGVYAFLLNAQGHIQADLYAFNRGDSLLVDTESGQCEKVLQLFDRYIIADDVEVADTSATITAIGMAGPQAR